MGFEPNMVHLKILCEDFIEKLTNNLEQNNTWKKDGYNQQVGKNTLLTGFINIAGMNTLRLPIVFLQRIKPKFNE